MTSREKMREYERAYRQRDPEGYRAKCRERQRKYRERNRNSAAYKARVRAHNFRAAQHGLALIEADRLIAAQGGVCAICGLPPGTAPPNHRLHIDHCHETGRIRGALCTNCNRALGHAKDNPDLLRRMADYLSAPPTSSSCGSVGLPDCNNG